MPRSLGWLGLAFALTGAVCLVVPGPGMYLAMGLGIFGAAAGLVGYRRRSAPGSARLAGAGGVTLGLAALFLGVAKYGLTLAALRRLEGLFS